MIEKVMSMVKAPWVPYVAIVAVALMIGLYGYGYMKGAHATEVEYTQLMNEALKRQMERNQKVAQDDLVAVSVSAVRRASLVEIIRTIEIPAPDVECSDPVWLHAYNDGVRAASPGARYPD